MRKSIFTKDKKLTVDQIQGRIDELAQKGPVLDETILKLENQLAESQALGEDSKNIFDQISRCERELIQIPNSIRLLKDEIIIIREQEIEKDYANIEVRFNTAVKTLTPYTEKIMEAVDEYNIAIDKLDLSGIPQNTDNPGNVLKGVVCRVPLAQFIEEFESSFPREKRYRLEAVGKVKTTRTMEDMGLSIEKKPSRLLSMN